MKGTFNESLKALRSQRQSLVNELSRLDKSIVDYSHLLELADLPDDIMLKVCTEFVRTLHKRRECKDNIGLLHSIDHKINTKKHYRPRVLHGDFQQYQQYIK